MLSLQQVAELSCSESPAKPPAGRLFLRPLCRCRGLFILAVLPSSEPGREYLQEMRDEPCGLLFHCCLKKAGIF